MASMSRGKIPPCRSCTTFGGGVEISRARVVAESLPGVQDLIFRSARERGEIGEAAEPLYYNKG